MLPLWVSHRGYKKAAVENTLEAFRAAIAAGFVALETDLRLSLDGHIVLHHDPDLRRLAGLAQPIASLNRSDLEAVRLGPDGARLMFLDEFIEEFAAYNWTFDIKPETGAAAVQALAALARSKGLVDWLMAQAKFVLWRPEHEALLYSLFPKAVCYAQERECWRAGLAVIAGVPAFGAIKPGRYYSLPPRLGPKRLYTRSNVDMFHRRGAHVLAFLPETDADARDAVSCGVDEILTNGLIVA